MTTTQKFNPETRKALAKALAEILETKHTYLGVPSCAYQVGDYHLAKNGELTGPDRFGLLTALHERGFDPEAEQEAGSRDQEAEDATTEATAETGPAKPDKSGLPKLYTLITPRGEIFITEEFTTHDEAAAEGYGECFSTALGTVYSYGDNHNFALVTENKAGDWDTTTMGRDFRAAAPAEEKPKRKGLMDCLVEALNEDAGEGDKWERLHRPPTIIDNSGREHNLDGTFAAQTESLEQFDLVCIEVPLDGFTPEKLDNLTRMVVAKEALIKKALGIDALPIQILSDRIAFPWFTATSDGAHIDAYAQFICALCKTAREKKRVTSKAPADGFENEAFAMRVFLLGLGLIGPEYKLARALLGRGLSGSSAWRYGVPNQEAGIAEEAPAGEPAAETEALEKAYTEDNHE